VQRLRAEMLLVIVLIFATATVAMAQNAGVTLSGVIHDPTGGLIPTATVTVTNSETSLSRNASTDQLGRYTVLGLPAGTYDVAATSQGFGMLIVRQQKFLVGTSVTLDFTLQLAKAAERVDVTSQTLAIQPTESTVGEVLQTSQLDNLPIDQRSFGELAALTPGVQVSTASITAGSAPGVSIGHGPTYSTGFAVDGFAMNPYEASSTLMINYAQDWIQEFSVITQQFPVEYGGAATGVINGITRSGTNSTHGRVYGFFQDAALNATPPFLPASAPNKPAYNQQRVGGMIGGPVKKGKLFYFAGYEYYRNLTSLPVSIPATFTGPAATSGVFPGLNETQLAMLKLDYQINPADRLTLSGNFEGDTTTNGGVGATGALVSTVGHGTNTVGQNYVYSAHWEHIFSPATISDARFLGSSHPSNPTCNYLQLVGYYPSSGGNSNPYGDPTGWAAQVTYPNAGVVTGCPVIYGGQNTAQDEMSENITHIHGSHQLKVGVNVVDSWWVQYANHNNTDGQYVVPGVVPFSPLNVATFPTSYFVTYVPPDKTYYRVQGWSLGAFLQDSWKVSGNLTLNLGLRYDLDFRNSALSNQIPPGLHNINNDYGDVAPRFGFAWTPFHDHKSTVVRGGAGLFYDQAHLNLAAVYVADTTTPSEIFNLNALRPAQNPYCIENPACSTSVPAQYLTAVEAVLASALTNYTLPNFNPPGGEVTVGNMTFAVPALPSIVGPGGTSVTAPTGGIFDIDKDIKTPRTLQVTAGAEHEFPWGLVVAADFVYVRGFDQYILRNININPQTLALVNPAYTTILSFGNGGLYTSRSLLAHAQYRSHRGDSVGVAYTFGYAWDNAIGGFTVSSHGVPATDPLDYNVDYGPSSSDARNTLVANAIVNVKGEVRLSPIVSLTSALPYTASTTLTTPGCLPYYSACYPTGYTRDSLRGDSTYLLNARASRAFNIRENKRITLLFEGFNLTNRDNYGVNYQSNVQAKNFMQPIAIATAKRQLQAGFRFDF
jgi:outer membrane receptor protein involved in Fe transport